MNHHRTQPDRPVGRFAGRTLMVLAALLFCLIATPVAGQLDQSCTVSALNRTAPVDADGVWVLPGVPSNLGPVRVRATCVADGVTRSGESDFFQVPARGVVQVPEILFGLPAQIPDSLALESPMARISGAGVTVQLSVTGHFSDGGAADLTEAASGTDYRVSNSAVATIDSHGLLTTHASGAVVVSAVNEGALAVLRLEVVASADSDGDGLPDDWEIAYGLDPNDPADALIDYDRDGLVNLEEYQAGTHPLDPDTDGDQLLDGEEPQVYGTDPLLFDTDGDGVPDGLEVQAGSDPTDPDSVNLPPILAGLSVAPESFTLIFNTLFGEASRLLTVTAILVDGTTLDATASRYGTSFQSSDLSIASFGADPGRVFAGANGSATVTATNGAFSADSFIQVESFAPTPLSFLALPGSPNAVAVDGDLAFVACGSAGLQIVDVFDPEEPLLIGSVDLPGTAFEVAVAEDIAYVAAGASGLAVVDVTIPSAPELLATFPTPAPALDVVVADEIAYLVDGTGLLVVDVSDPYAPALVDSVGLPGRPRGVDVAGDLAVVAAESAGIHVVDIADAEGLELIGSTSTRPDGRSDASTVVVRDQTAYVADGARTLGGLKVVDLSAPTTPVVVGASGDRFGLNEVAVEGRFVFAADYFFVNGVPIFNVAVPTPFYTGVIDFSSRSPFRDDNGLGIAVADGLVFLAGNRSQARRFGTTGNGGLYIARYVRPEEEPLEPQPPTVELVNPPPGSEVRERAFLVVGADASDDVRVDRVEFFLGGELLATDSAKPYRVRVQVPFGAGSVLLGATAFDSAGNSTSAEPLELTVLPDGRPTVRLLAPTTGQRALQGRTFEVAAEATDDLEVDRVEFLIDGVIVATDSTAPYRRSLPVPDQPSFAVAAIAYDNVEQSDATEAVSVPVDPDAPPLVAILSPTDGAEVIDGGVVWVSVGATDDYGLVDVTIAIDGEPVAVRDVPPFDIPIRVPAGASAFTITAIATDGLDQSTTSEQVELSVIADPLTTVEGRVVDASGSGVAGVQVGCAGLGDSSGPDGSFLVAGVPTASGRISCHAEHLVDGELFSGGTEPVPPVLGGVTEVGALPVLPGLLYAGNEPFGPGRMLVLDSAASRFLPWSASVGSAGLSGLAFDLHGRLWATTYDEDGGDGGDGEGGEIPLPGETQGFAKFGGYGASRLLQLDPDTGEVLVDVGDVVDGFGSTVPVEDLTYDPVSQRLFGIDGEPFEETSVFAIDTSTGVATLLADGYSLSEPGIALASDGLLYLLGYDDLETPPEHVTVGSRSGSKQRVEAAEKEFEGLVLIVLDPADGREVRAEEIQGGIDSGVGALLAETNSSFLVASNRSLYRLDLGSLEISEVETPDGSYSEGLGGLARRPLAAPPTTTDVVGTALDEEGTPVADVAITTIGGADLTDESGEFLLAGVVVRSGRVRVLAESLGETRFSEAVAPVADGITDVGVVRLGARTCASGRLIYADFGDTCATGPVTGVVNMEVLIEEDDEGVWVQAGSFLAGADGSFCADIRRGATYVLWQDGTPCDCGSIGYCEADLLETDPDSSGRCSDPSSSCEVLGDVPFVCYAFCP